MPNFAKLSRFGASCAALLALIAGPGMMRAQPAEESPSTKTTNPEAMSQADLLKSYLTVREQLQAAQMAIVNNRLEAEATARAQAATITAKLDAINLTMGAERKLQQAQADRAEYERERQLVETQQSNRNILWMAAAFGGLGLLTMLLTALFHWRAINRMANVMALGPAQLPAPGQSGLLTTETGANLGESVALSGQRMMSVIDRMERRIFELEHTAVNPPPTGSTPPFSSSMESASVAEMAAAIGQPAWIAELLGQGRSLLHSNQAREAVACFDEILKLDPHHAEALVRKGSALERLKQDHEALEYYDRAIEADRKMTIAYLSKGGVCNRLERYEEAAECYEQALQTQEAVK
jgi:tetratricopeptide (TPR) repeat protein